MNAERYLERIGVDPASVTAPDRETLERLQRAHATSVPFETLAITGHPWDGRGGDGVVLDPETLYEKIVERRRGGFCYELNGLFSTLLAELGYEVDRLAGAVLQDGEPTPPANHLTSRVTLDRAYIVDVGLGSLPIRRPLPLDGEPRRDGAGVAWRAIESDRPDHDILTQYRYGSEDWTDRYVCRLTPRSLSYVAATCEYLTAAPESPFTGDPVLTMGTDDGYVKLTPESLTRWIGGEERTEAVDRDEWEEHVETTFGVPLDAL